MRSLSTLAFAALLAAAVGDTASAQDVALSEYRVSLASLYQEAKSQAPSLLAAEANTRRSEALKEAAAGRLLPQLSLQSSLSRTYYRNDRDSAAYDGKRAGLTLSQALYDPAVAASVSRAENTVEQAQSEELASHHRTAVTLVERYFEVLASEERTALLAEQISATELNLERVSSLLERQLARLTDRLALEANLALLKAQHTAAENDSLIARETLAELVGYAPTNRFAGLKSDSSLLELIPDVSFEQLLEDALQFNPDIGAKRAAVQVQRAALDEAQAGHKPRLAAQATADYSNIGYGNAPSSNTRSGTLGITLSIPIYSGGSASARVQAALEDLAIAEQELELTQRRIQREVRIGLSNLSSSRARMKASGRAIESAEQALAAAKNSFNYGIANVVDVVNRESDLFESKSELNQAKYDFINSYITLLSLRNELSAETIKTIDALLTQNGSAAARQS